MVDPLTDEAVNVLNKAYSDTFCLYSHIKINDAIKQAAETMELKTGVIGSNVAWPDSPPPPLQCGNMDHNGYGINLL